jgi:nitrate/nitrite transport system ATP-binding protein
MNALNQQTMSTATTKTVTQNIADSILEPVLTPSTAIAINNVTVSFKTPKGTYTAVKEISLTVQKGEIISLIGHSGCGKSTLMGTISGMVKPTTGEVIANGKAVSGPGPDRGIVFQNYSLLPWLTVYRDIYEAVDSALKDLSKGEKREL